MTFFVGMFGELESIESLSTSLNRSDNAKFFREVDLRLSSANDIVYLSASVVGLLNFSAMRLLFASIRRLLSVRAYGCVLRASWILLYMSAIELLFTGFWERGRLGRHQRLYCNHCAR